MRKATVLVASEGEGEFNITWKDPVGKDSSLDDEPPRGLLPLERVHVPASPNGECPTIGRVMTDDLALGYLINCGPSAVRIQAMRGFIDEIGPRAEWLLPGQCKEIGIGPGLRWMLIPAP